MGKSTIFTLDVYVDGPRSERLSNRWDQYPSVTVSYLPNAVILIWERGPSTASHALVSCCFVQAEGGVCIGHLTRYATEYSSKGGMALATPATGSREWEG